MKIIQLLTVAALAAAFTVSASAFPYTNPTYSVGPVNTAQVPPSPKGGSIASSARSTATDSTIAVYTQGRGVAKTTVHQAHVKSAAQR